MTPRANPRAGLVPTTSPVDEDVVKSHMRTFDLLRTGLHWARATVSYLAWTRGETAKGSGRVQAGDINIFYKWFGFGEPILMLHGGFTAIEGWVAQIPELSRSYFLIGMDSRGHGRTTLGNAGLLRHRSPGADNRRGQGRVPRSPRRPLAIFEALRDAMPNAAMTVIPSGSHGLHVEYRRNR